MLSEKVIIVRLLTRQIKRISLHKMSYCLEPDIYNRSKLKFEL